MIPDAHFVRPELSLNQLQFWAIRLAEIRDCVGMLRSDGSVIGLEPEQQLHYAKQLDYVVQEMDELLNDTIEVEDKVRINGYTKAEAACAGVKV